MMVALLQVSGSSAVRRGTATRTVKKRSASSQAKTTLAPRQRVANRSVKEASLPLGHRFCLGNQR